MKFSCGNSLLFEFDMLCGPSLNEIYASTFLFLVKNHFIAIMIFYRLVVNDFQSPCRVSMKV